MSQSRRNNLNVRRLSPAEWAQALPVIFQLRSLDEAEFLRRVRRQSYSGYELVGAFKDSELVGVMGMRPVHTLARGAYLHIDDIVVTAEARGSGTGQALMEYAEADARARDMSTCVSRRQTRGRFILRASKLCASRCTVDEKGPLVGHATCQKDRHRRLLACGAAIARRLSSEGFSAVLHSRSFGGNRASIGP